MDLTANVSRIESILTVQWCDGLMGQVSANTRRSLIRY